MTSKDMDRLHRAGKMDSDRHMQRPSQVTDAFWIVAGSSARGYPSSTSASGKWLLFVRRDQVDDSWEKVRRALGQGKLGASAKVSTARPNPNATNPGNHVICVYTYDSDDVGDVMRIREELRGLGFEGKIPYKTDEATIEGKYRVRGDTRVSKYYC